MPKTMTELADLAGVQVEMVRRLVRSGYLKPVVKVGGKPYFDASVVEEVRRLSMKNPLGRVLIHRIGERVRTRRAELGMTQRGLASRCRMGQPRVVEIEKGRRDIQISTLAALARALETTATDLLSARVEAQTSHTLER